MAQLGNTIINGALRITGNIYGSMVTPFCVCTTSSSTSEKTVTCNGFALIDGARIVVMFQNYLNISSSLLLNVNGTGGKPMSINSDSTNSNTVIEFIYSSSSDRYYQIGYTGDQLV